MGEVEVHEQWGPYTTLPFTPFYNQSITNTSSHILLFTVLLSSAGLGEFRIRDLNDEINKLLREKGHWEVRIKELGGPDYGRVGPKMTDMDGQEAPGNRWVGEGLMFLPHFFSK